MIGDGHRARSTMPAVHVPTTLLASPDFLMVTAASRGYWIALLGFCARAENGGRVAGAAKWAEAQWAIVLGSGGSRAVVDVLATEGLCEWSSGTLIVSGYPTDAERVYRAQRSGGRKGAAERWSGGPPKTRDKMRSDRMGSDPIRLTPTGSPIRSPIRSPTGSPTDTAAPEREPSVAHGQDDAPAGVAKGVAKGGHVRTHGTSAPATKVVMS